MNNSWRGCLRTKIRFRHCGKNKEFLSLCLFFLYQDRQRRVIFAVSFFFYRQKSDDLVARKNFKLEREKTVVFGSWNEIHFMIVICH